MTTVKELIIMLQKVKDKDARVYLSENAEFQNLAVMEALDSVTQILPKTSMLERRTSKVYFSSVGGLELARSEGYHL